MVGLPEPFVRSCPQVACLLPPPYEREHMIQYASSLLFLRRLKVFSARHRRFSGDGRGRPWRISRTILDLLILAIFVTIVVAKSLLVTRMICLRCAMYGPECFGHDAAPVHLVCPPICLLPKCR